MIFALENESHLEIQTTQPSSFQKFSSYTDRQTVSHTVSKWRDRNCRKPRETFGHRKWTNSNHDTSIYRDKIVLVSYNILGVDNATKHPELYRDVSPKHLDWEFRKKLLCKEVTGYQPSILCFQEVDHFDDLNDIFGKNGFKGVHKARTGEACDGCAIFWKAEQFTLLHEEGIDFQRFGLRNNVAQLCVLKMNQTSPSGDDMTESYAVSPSLVIGNIHVLYNPKRGDIKLGQMRIFLQKAFKLSQEWGCIPVVIAADMNSLPQSAMYQFLASSELHTQQHDRRKISGQTRPSELAGTQLWRNNVWRWTAEELMLATGSRNSYLRHPLKLSSAYANIPGSFKYRDKVGEPLATSYHSMFTGTVDYIWHTLDLAPVRVLETLPMHTLKKTGGLPSKKWGSDHLALVCELAFVNDGN
ncbi:carbon catabolite repressor protein 45 [Dorcoceras hygrometricum]|uniref:Carbon catabolite repressor protein 45 n=1 Tax=Dorcoceras hygrometricum TaxID=472368 RepID=A0A2Z7BM45_9LAMI|nr:carbon catabolite repressor protein 45 [Dorcoceras hygrometricum]